jgi:hypothetical protein
MFGLAASGAAGVNHDGGVRMRKASVVAGTVAVAAAGSVLFGGSALAWGGWHHHGYFNQGGNGVGGTATNNCLNVGVPIASGIGLAGSGDAKSATCNVSANGSGGSAY